MVARQTTRKKVAIIRNRQLNKENNKIRKAARERTLKDTWKRREDKQRP